MSKNITIAEDGTSRTFSDVAKIQTNLVDGGTCYWVPEDETKVTSLSVTENGTYKASDEGYYGYDKVTVNITGGSVNGYDADTGEYENITVDDETGEIVKKVIPYWIAITTEPDKTEYDAVGDEMDYTNMVVKLLKWDGTLFTDDTYPDGIIPQKELILLDKVPEPTSSGDDSDDDSETSVGGGHSF